MVRVSVTICGQRTVFSTVSHVPQPPQLSPPQLELQELAPQGPQLQTGYQNDFGAQRDEVINSLMGRIDEERGRDLEGLRTQLLNDTRFHLIADTRLHTIDF